MALALAAVAASLVLSLLPAPSGAVVRVILDRNSSSVDFPAEPALFGVPLAPEGVQGYLTEAKPANACQPIEGPRPGRPPLGAIVLIRRHDCTFDLKVLHAQRAGFQAAIVHNVGSNDLVRMAPVYEDLRRQIAIPSVFVGEAASQDLRVIVHCDRSAHVLLLPGARACRAPDCRPALAAIWVPGRTLALAASGGLLVGRLWLWWRGGGARAPAIKTPPRPKARVRTFTRRHDLCAICLEDYEEGERLKVLPCAHAYHCGCIDPWLARAAPRACPLCKRSVASTEDGSDSTGSSLGDDDPGPLLHRPPLWAIQAQLRSRRLELLTTAGRRHSAMSLGVADAEESSDRRPTRS